MSPQAAASLQQAQLAAGIPVQPPAGQPTKAELLAQVVEWLQELGAPASTIGVVVAELAPYLG